MTDQENLMSGTNEDDKEGFCDNCNPSKACGICCSISLGLFLWLALRIWSPFGLADCALETFDYKDILPKNAKANDVPEPFDRGTRKNMHIKKSLDLDLAGTWWMDGNPLTFEQLVSYAGAFTDREKYPLIMEAPSSMPRRWTWSDTFVGRAIIFYYMWTTFPEETHVYNFTNNTYADIVPVAGVISGLFGFKNINANEWDRVETYTLRRIVDGEGKPTKFWPKFEKWYPEQFPSGSMVVVSSDNGCLRRCQYILPCFMCFFCGGR
jgi:hypothetical protein